MELGATFPLYRRGVTGRLRSGWRPPGRPKHAAWDIDAPIGSPVRAAFSGVVKAATRKGGAGCVVWLDHGNGLSSLSMHLSGFAVDKGELVAEGDVIGESGKTGNAQGPHLHFAFLVTPLWLAEHRIELGLVDGENYTRARKWPGFFLDPGVLLDDDELLELAGLGAADKPRRTVKRGVLFGDKPPPKYKIKKWCEWQGKQAAWALLAAGAVVMLPFLLRD